MAHYKDVAEHTAEESHYISGIAQCLGKIAEEVKAREGESEEFRHIVWESKACNFAEHKQIVEGQDGKLPVRFFPMWGFVGVENPEPQTSIPKEAIPHFQARRAEVRHPRLQARYADILWELARDYTAAKQAIVAYCQVARWGRAKKEREHEILDAIDRAVVLCHSLSDEGALKDCIALLEDHLQHFKEIDMGRWCLEAFDILAFIKQKKFRHLLPDDKYRAAIKLCEQIESGYVAKKGYEWAGDFQQRRVVAAGVLKDEGMKKESERKIVETLIARADVFLKDNFRLEAASLSDQALALAIQFGLNDLTDQLKVRVAGAYQNLEQHFMTISTTIEIPAKEVEAAQGIFLEPKDLNDCLDRLAKHELMVLDVAKLRESIKKDFGRTISDHMTQVFVGDAQKVAVADTEDEKIQLEVIGTLCQEAIRNAAWILQPVIQHLHKERGLTTDAFETYMRRWVSLDDARMPFVRAGLDRYWAGDYVSALHILVPQLEALIRHFFAKAGVPIINLRGDAHEFLTFTSLLYHPGVKKGLGDNLHSYLTAVLVEQRGLNLRNDIAHGLVRWERCNQQMAGIVLHMLLIVTTFK